MSYRVAVLGPGAFAARPRLWKALEQAFPVRFEPPGAPQPARLKGVIAHGVETLSQPPLPTLYANAGHERPAGARVRMTRGPALAECLRGQALSDDRAALLPCVVPQRGETVLAGRDRAPLWTVRAGTGTTYRCAALPEELGPGEALRERFRAGRFIALLPLLAFLRNLTEGCAWTRPQPRAAFMFDDPSLHWPSYGHIDFADIAKRATRGGFHVAFATVPIDAWYANRRLVRLLRERRCLSLLLHGNQHLRCELGRVRDERAALALAADAVRRVAALERRTGLSVTRVMAPPHGECSEVALRGLRRAGLLAACISRPYPWLRFPPPDRPLAQWDVADVVAGLPVLPRHSLGASREDLPLRAFLGQPLILYGHHGDLAGGSTVLEQLAEDVNGLGEVRWSDLGEIARASFLTRQDGGVLRVRMLAREIEVDVPGSVERVVFEAPGADEGADVLLRGPGTAGFTAAPLGQETALAATAGVLRARLRSADTIDVERVPASSRRLWPYARRLLVHGRDRLAPAISTAARS